MFLLRKISRFRNTSVYFKIKQRQKHETIPPQKRNKTYLTNLQGISIKIIDLKMFYEKPVKLKKIIAIKSNYQIKIVNKNPEGLFFPRQREKKK